MVQSVCMGEIAGLMHIVATVNSQVKKLHKVKVPHMVYEDLKWIKKAPSSHPLLTVGVEVAVSGYRELGLPPLPATRRRSADITALPDTGCQATCMGLKQLNLLGLSKNDLFTPELNLKTANATGINVLGVVFLTIQINHGTGKTSKTNETCS